MPVRILAAAVSGSPGAVAAAATSGAEAEPARGALGPPRRTRARASSPSGSSGVGRRASLETTTPRCRGSGPGAGGVFNVTHDRLDHVRDLVDEPGLEERFSRLR